jgi:hypothetical protein
MPVGIEESLRLKPALLIYGGINSTSLHNTTKVKIGLTVAYKVNFFDAQFSVNLARPNRQAGAKIRIYR